MVLVSNSGGIIIMPSKDDVYDGKVLSIRNIASGTNKLKPNSGELIRDTGGWHKPSDSGRDLNNDERAELVYFTTYISNVSGINNGYYGVWYLNMIGT